MARLMRHVPVLASSAWIVLAKLTGYSSVQTQLLALLLTAAGFFAIRQLAVRAEASPIHKGMALFTAAASVSAWVGPADVWPCRYPVASLYAALFLVAVLPPLLGRDVFTIYFARKTTPQAVWNTSVFLTINRHLTALWAVLFAASFASALIAGKVALHGLVWETLLEGLIPGALMLGIGLPANKLYPEHYQRKRGLAAAGGAGTGPDSTPKASLGPPTEAIPLHKERQTMGSRFAIVAVNGSPHAGIGNTATMLEMLRPALAAEGLSLEVIHLGEHDIDYCVGCGVCLEKGRCWIQDDHAGIVERLLAADGIILASPVYFQNVTAQMKTFLDRSLAFGHKPQPHWKPGLAVSVSAGHGETDVAEYLGSQLRAYGAFSVGRLTALATGPGEFLGKSAVEARARDLAGDLARAVKEKRRYPATDSDLIFYQFMGALVSSHKDTIMKDDYAHWKEHDFFEGFEKYVQQHHEKTNHDPEMRKAWIQDIIAEHKRNRGEPSGTKPEISGTRLSFENTCRELIRRMPFGFNPSAAEGIEAVYQFEITDGEEFVSHLRISQGRCTHHEGPADAPSVTIKSPSDVWLAISKGTLDGQYAFMSGKFFAEGDLALLIKLKSFFSAK